MILLTLLACSKMNNGIPTGYISFEHDGMQREYLLHIPEEAPENPPLLFVLHGYWDNARSIQRYSKLNEVADEHGFAVVYPQGTRDSWMMRFWDVGYTFHKEEDISVDDSGFLIALAEYLQKEYQLDKNRTYMTGFSNGGDMSYMIACQEQDTFSGFVPIAGLMMEDWLVSCEASKGAAIFAIHGTADDVTYYDGDLQDSEGWGFYVGVERAVQFWNVKNQCQQSNQEISMAGEMEIKQTKHTGCKDDSKVWLYALQDDGHEWPDQEEFKAQEALWTFLSGLE